MLSHSGRLGLRLYFQLLSVLGLCSCYPLMTVLLFCTVGVEKALLFLTNGFPHGVKTDTDEVRRMHIDRVYTHKFCIAENGDTALAVCQGYRH